MSYKVAIIGAGIVSGSHSKAIGEMNELQAAGIADINKDRAKEAGIQYHTNYYDDYKEMVRNEKPDIVVITLPHFLHKETAVWCMDQGCHLMLEKPMALNAKECDEIIAAAAKNKVQLMVGHTQHYIAENIKAKEIIQLGELGELVMINDTRHVNYYDPRRPEWFFEKEKSGGGIFMNLGSHSVDKIQWLTDSKIKKVKASMSFHGIKGNIEGSGIAFLETSNAIPATISQSGYGGVNKDTTEFIFTKGMLKLLTGVGLWISEQGQFQEITIPSKIQPFVLQFRDLLKSIESNLEPESSGTYGKSVIEVVETLYRSHEMGTELMIE